MSPIRSWNLHLPHSLSEFILWALVIHRRARDRLCAAQQLAGLGPHASAWAPKAKAEQSLGDGKPSLEGARREAEDLAREGRFDEAMHVLLLRAVGELRDNLKLTIADSLTAREIERRAPLDERGKSAFGRMVHAVEHVVFGQAPADADAYDSLPRRLRDVRLLARRRGASMSDETEQGGFSPRIAAALGGLALALFALALIFTGGSDVDAENSAGANSYSRSAIGHRALFETLAKLGRNVVRADVDPLGKLGDRGVLVLIEPTSAANDPALATKIRAAQRVLLVLPKTYAAADPDHPGWVRDAVLVRRRRSPRRAFSWSMQKPASRKAPSRSRSPSIISSRTPTIAKDAQSVTGGDFHVLLGDKDGFLVGERVIGGRRIVVLADPDPIENLGILQGDNAAFDLPCSTWSATPNDEIRV